MQTHARASKKLARILSILLLVCLVLAPTALAESPAGTDQTENLTLKIKTVDTELEREPSVIDIYQGQYVGSGKYQLYEDEALSKPVHFTRLHAHYTVCQEDDPDATIDMICNLGVVTVEGLRAGTYWLTQTEPPTERLTLTRPIKLTLTSDTSQSEEPTSKLSLDETVKNPTAKIENDHDLVIDYNDTQDAFAQTMLIILAILLIIIIIIVVYIFTKNHDKQESDQVHQP